MLGRGMTMGSYYVNHLYCALLHYAMFTCADFCLLDKTRQELEVNISTLFFTICH